MSFSSFTQNTCFSTGVLDIFRSCSRAPFSWPIVKPKISTPCFLNHLAEYLGCISQHDLPVVTMNRTFFELFRIPVVSLNIPLAVYRHLPRAFSPPWYLKWLTHTIKHISLLLWAFSIALLFAYSLERRSLPVTSKLKVSPRLHRTKGDRWVAWNSYLLFDSLPVCGTNIA